jgi:putative methyltransferase (TIGR04325 family)
MSTFRRIVKDWLPPELLRIIRGFSNLGIRFEGEFDTWEAAVSKCSGYDADNILNKVLEATLKVKQGEAVYERDSVLFDEIQYTWPVTAALMFSAAKNKGKLNVLDFGGALGSSYLQNRRFLKGIADVKWSVVEQANFVEAGKKHIEDHVLRFYSSIESCLKVNRPNVILLSSVLQYLENPYELLKKISEIDACLIIIDRSPFKDEGNDEVFIQKVPKKIYDASYPMWVFSKSKFMDFASKNWHLISEEISPEGEFKINEVKFSFQGMIFERQISK